ncbi:expressed unknown protein [Seminavis robusta]|uniref:Uncharacterized protein n=1 Tax=Seminavis robusta TaxID=568900 RepID=A0A9N8DP31_9STRA|nr:expressed unknown protein [Seminavis robusta]|eukprot:Sro253_g100020.1 n/a (555) ;mRNA; r:74098-75762
MSVASAGTTSSSSNNSADEADDGWKSSWSACHYKTCLSQSSLVACPEEVQKFNSNQGNDKSKILWSIPQQSEVTIWNYASSSREHESGESMKTHNAMMESLVVNHLASVETEQEDAANEKTSSDTPTSPMKQQESSGGVMQYVTSALSPIAGLFSPSRPMVSSFYDEEDDALKDWSEFAKALEEEEDDAKQPPKIDNTTNPVAWQDPILNIPLTVECFLCLQEAVEQSCQAELTTDHGFPLMLSRRRSATNTTYDQSETPKFWIDWVQAVGHRNNQHTPQTLLTRLSETHIDFLLDCLVSTGKITLIQHDDEELVAFMPKQQQEQQMYLEFLASWYKISRAVQVVEHQREQWSQKSQQWARRALQERQSSSIEQAGLVSFKLHKQYQKHLEETEGTLLNLEQAQHAMETSWHQQQLVDALKTSNLALQQQQQQQKIGEQVDNVMETYRNELELLGTMEQSWASSTHPSTELDEEDLMAELVGLSLPHDSQGTLFQGNHKQGLLSSTTTPMNSSICVGPLGTTKGSSSAPTPLKENILVASKGEERSTKKALVAG